MREYGPVAIALGAARALPDDASRRAALVDAIWSAHGGDGPGRGVSWVGFYQIEPDGRSMVLRERRDKPACSPIGLQGACGRCWMDRHALVVRDVVALGDNYIACDPRDRSEAVIPLVEPDGSCWGVLDLDSFEVGAFDPDDARELTRLLALLNLTTGPTSDAVVI
ncbi:MAG: GAF domain-containing protein [Phycisphaeraceae bacterium]|nr:GAF domain-containing protein [Phycisphaeraceae bacterium]